MGPLNPHRNQHLPKSSSRTGRAMQAKLTKQCFSIVSWTLRAILATATKANA
jgi:hypothetical protein